MAAASTTKSNSIRNEASREEIQAAIAKAAELRAIHAALMQGNSPTHSNLFPSSPPPPPPQLSAHDYPVFTPSYEDETLGAGYYHLELDNRVCSEGCSDEYALTGDNGRSRKEAAVGLDSQSVSSLGDLKSVPNSSIAAVHVPLTDSHPRQPRSKGTVLSRLFPRLKKKPKGDDSDPVILRELGVLSVEALKKELGEANQKRDAALAEVAEIRSSFGDLRKKLESVEGYCEELQRALRQAGSMNGLPVSEEVMVEGFLQIVSEARLSVKQFCKMLVGHTEGQLLINTLLEPAYSMSLVGSTSNSNSKHARAALCHVEAIINQTLYQDFENSVFQKNGPPKLLDPQQDRQAHFSSFVALRNLSWSEVLRKGTKYHSEELSRFCDQKMSCIITRLSSMRPWPEQLLQSFFVAAKCVWLLHLLAFSFCPPLTILRVEDNRAFHPRYMDDLLLDRHTPLHHTPTLQVKIMVMPGFYVQDKILRCKVICTPKSSP